MTSSIAILRPRLPLTSRLARLFVAAGLIVASATSAGSAQEASVSSDAGDTLTGFFTEVMDVRVINVDVFVNDRSGMSIAGLGQGDFELRVDGDLTPISNFYSASTVGTPVAAEIGGREAESSFRTIEEVAAEPPGELMSWF